jgi:serine/threonine-protein kinase HipA
MSSKSDEMIVVLDAPELGALETVGVLSHWPDSGAVAFAYAHSWLTNDGFQLEPRLPLRQGQQYFPHRSPPPILLDTSPDAWGTLLMERRAGRQLTPFDLLVGVDDSTRMGALRLQRVSDRAYVGGGHPPIPPMAHLRELEMAARTLEQSPDALLDRDLELLLAPGSSLGGARPKANYQSSDGSLWIAKFPSRTDRADSGAWEYAYAELAKRALVETPPSRLLTLGAGGRTFATRRFDRSTDGRRLYASAMTMTSHDNGDTASYPDIAQAIRQFGDPDFITQDLAQLFRRLVFNILASNRDDHLRNHGFLRAAGGWRLAPAFDMNPARPGHPHVLSIDGQTHASSLRAAFDTYPIYGLRKTAAQEIIREVSEALVDWPEVASMYGISATEQQRVGEAFTALADVFDLVQGMPSASTPVR